MEIQSSVNQIKELITESKKVAVFAHKNPTLDSMAALLAFGQMLDKLHKEYYLICGDPVPQELMFLKGSDKVASQVGTRNVIIGIKNGKELVEKVSYYTQDNDFNLIITPRGKAITPDQIEYTITGLDADVLIVLNTIRLTGLGPIVDTFAQEFKDLPLVNIDRHSQNTRYGKLNLVDNERSSTTEILLPLVDALGIEIDADLATTLLAGIYGGSRNFMSQTTSTQSFKDGLKLLEAGADLHLILNNLSTYYKSEDRKNEEQRNEEKAKGESKDGEESSSARSEGETVSGEEAATVGNLGENAVSTEVPMSDDTHFEHDTENDKTEQKEPAVENEKPVKDETTKEEKGEQNKQDGQADEYQLPTPTLKTYASDASDSPFADPKLYQN